MSKYIYVTTVDGNRSIAIKKKHIKAVYEISGGTIIAHKDGDTTANESFAIIKEQLDRWITSYMPQDGLEVILSVGRVGMRDKGRWTCPQRQEISDVTAWMPIPKRMP